MHPGTFAGRRGITAVAGARRAGAGLAPHARQDPLVPIGESFANLLPEEDAETFGVIYEITADDLAHVDLTEGVLIGNYRRIEIAVEPLSGAGPARAFTLVSDKRSPDLLPSDYYMALLSKAPRPTDFRRTGSPCCAPSPPAVRARRSWRAGNFWRRVSPKLRRR